MSSAKICEALAEALLDFSGPDDLTTWLAWCDPSSTRDVSLE